VRDNPPTLAGAPFSSNFCVLPANTRAPTSSLKCWRKPGLAVKLACSYIAVRFSPSGSGRICLPAANIQIKSIFPNLRAQSTASPSNLSRTPIRDRADSSCLQRALFASALRTHCLHSHHAPKRLRDLLWTPPRFAPRPRLKAPNSAKYASRYFLPFSWRHADEAVRLGRATVWESTEGYDDQIPFWPEDVVGGRRGNPVPRTPCARVQSSLRGRLTHHAFPEDLLNPIRRTKPQRR